MKQQIRCMCGKSFTSFRGAETHKRFSKNVVCKQESMSMVAKSVVDLFVAAIKDLKGKKAAHEIAIKEIDSQLQQLSDMCVRDKQLKEEYENAI